MFHGVILAGGRGERLWPVNRQNHPKHLLAPKPHETMLEESIRRIEALVPPKHVLVVTHRNYLDAIETHLRGKIEIGGYVVEPQGKNTAVAIGLAALKLLKRDPTATMYVLPADHFVGEEDRLLQALRAAARLTLEGERLVAIGVNPTRPEPNYGYIEMGAPVEGHFDVPVFSAEAFKEKPTTEEAVGLMARGTCLWNTGMYVWKATVLMEALQRFMPELYGGLKAIENDLETEREEDALRGLYTRIGNISIDYGVMEKADNVSVIRGSFVWDDYADWEVVSRVVAADEHGNVIRGNAVTLDSKSTLVWSEDGVIATLGVENLVVVRQGDAVLICPRSRARDVKFVVKELKERGLDEFA
jgi:mannose-1-phosphate guanylyltransferase